MRCGLAAPHRYAVTPVPSRAAGEKTALREEVGRSPRGEGFEWAGRDELSSARGDQAETDGDEPAGVHDMGVDGGDRAGDEQDDVVVVVVIVETGNPCRVRRAGIGARRKREQDTQKEDDERRPSSHGPATIRRRNVGRKWPQSGDS